MRESLFLRGNIFSVTCDLIIKHQKYGFRVSFPKLIGWTGLRLIQFIKICMGETHSFGYIADPMPLVIIHFVLKFERCNYFSFYSLSTTDIVAFSVLRFTKGLSSQLPSKQFISKWHYTENSSVISITRVSPDIISQRVTHFLLKY